MVSDMQFVLGRVENVGKRENACNSLSNNKILDHSKFKELADDKINATKKLKFVKGMAENILGKGENAGYQHFILFPKCFHKLFSSG